MNKPQWILLISALAISLSLSACGADTDDDKADENAINQGNGTTNQGNGTTNQADCLQAELIDRKIDSDTTLGPAEEGCPAYRVSGDIKVEATLTVEPGTIVEFDEGAQLTFMRDSRLIAKGTKEEPILFTGTKKEPGWWRGVYLRRPGTTVDSQLEHITFEYGGYEGSANLVVSGSSSADSAALSIKNTTLRKSSGPGLILNENTTLRSFEENILTENEGVPLELHPNHVHLLDQASTYTGNGQDVIYIDASSSLVQDGTWPNLDQDVSYTVDGFFEVRADLTIEEGTTFAFTAGSGVRVMTDGSFKALGTEQNPISFTAADTDDGWLGLVISRSEEDNQITYATIEHGGAAEFRDIAANLQIGDTAPAKATITNSTFEHSKGYGLYARKNTDVNEEICDVNQFDQNANEDCLIEE